MGNYFKNILSFQRASSMLQAVSNTNSKRKNNKLVDLIKSRLNDLKRETEEMSKDEIKVDKKDKIVDIAEKILECNNQNQERQGLKLKILTPDQMLSRLPITLAQLKAVNNSEKLKNEIRQLLHFLHRSKKLTKTIYDGLHNTI